MRAIAVVPVLLFHAGVGGFSGGFVGVDVFFVISGYLITSLILPEIQQGRFSITTFYERRARRILPALFGVMCFSAAIAYYVFLSGDLRDFSNSLIATALFSSNFLFWSELGYFAAPAEVKPLLHTWSLAVEEQFYILFPIFLVIVHRFLGKFLVPLILIGIVGSSALSIALVDARPDDAFYLPHSRAWELLLGSILAFNILPKLSNPSIGNILSASGLTLIGASVALIDQTTPFPGLTAIPPCLGAFLVIWSNEQRITATGRLLAVRPLVGIGLISYSLYLWHWPLIVFSKYVLARPLATGETIGILALSFLAAGLSWKYVENPFRGRTSRFTRVHIFSGSCVAALTLVVAGAAGNLTDGFSSRPNRSALVNSPHEDEEACFKENGLELLESSQLCILGEDDGSSPDFVVWGDSHANAAFPMFASAAAASGTYGLFAAMPACPPLLGVTRPLMSEPWYLCEEFNDAVFDLIADRGNGNVFLVARWNLSVLGRTPYELGIGERDVFINDEQSTELSYEENLRTFERGLDRTLGSLSEAGINTWLVLQVPNPEVRVPQYLAARMSGAQNSDMRLRLTRGIERHNFMRDRIASIASRYGTELLDPADILCTGLDCLIARDGYNVYNDDDHLSVKGSLLLQPMFERILSNLRK